MPIFYHQNLDDCLYYSEESARTTHQADDCLSANRYCAEILFKIFNGERNKAALFENFQSYDWTNNMQRFWHCEFKHKSIDEISSSGYVIHTLEAALWSFWHTDNFRDAILKASNLGDDADTVAAVCGQIAGAFYGVENIPQSWREKLYRSDDIHQIAIKLAHRGADVK